MRARPQAAGVRLVTGDTKVVDRGKGDGVFINTAGIGVVEHGLDDRARERARRATRCCSAATSAATASPSWRCARAWSSSRAIESDCAPLAEPVLALLDGRHRGPLPARPDPRRAGERPHRNRRDGGAAIDIDETAIPVREDVRAACEILGLDPLYVANEGRFVAFVPAATPSARSAGSRRFASARPRPSSARSARRPAGRVTCKSAIGARRILDMLTGDQLPRIC